MNLCCRFWTHIVMAYAFTFWTCFVLLKEYETVASMRLHFLASEKRRPDQYTVSEHSLEHWRKWSLVKVLWMPLYSINEQISPYTLDQKANRSFFLKISSICTVKNWCDWQNNQIVARSMLHVVKSSLPLKNIGYNESYVLVYYKCFFVEFDCCRFLFETYHRILMNLLVRLWSIFSWSITQTLILQIRWVPFAFVLLG